MEHEGLEQLAAAAAVATAAVDCICSATVRHRLPATFATRQRPVSKHGDDIICDNCYASIFKWLKKVRQRFPCPQFSENDTVQTTSPSVLLLYAARLQSWKPCQMSLVEPCGDCICCIRVARFRAVAARKQAVATVPPHQPVTGQPTVLQLRLHGLRVFIAELTERLANIVDAALKDRILQQAVRCTELHGILSARLIVGIPPEQQSDWIAHIDAAINPYA